MLSPYIRCLLSRCRDQSFQAHKTTANLFPRIGVSDLTFKEKVGPDADVPDSFNPNIAEDGAIAEFEGFEVLPDTEASTEDAAIAEFEGSEYFPDTEASTEDVAIAEYKGFECFPGTEASTEDGAIAECEGFGFFTDTEASVLGKQSGFSSHPLLPSCVRSFSAEER